MQVLQDSGVSEEAQKKIARLYRISSTHKTVEMGDGSYDEQEEINGSNKKNVMRQKYKEQLVSSGKISAEIKFVKIYSDNEIVYYDGSNKAQDTHKGCLHVFNPFENKAQDGFGQRLPTTQAVPDNDSNEEKVMSMLDGIDLVVLRESGIIAVLEQKHVYINSNDHVVSFYVKGQQTPSSHPQANDAQKQYYLQKVNERDTVIVYNPSCIDSQLTFLLYRYAPGEQQSDIQQNEITVQENFNCQIINLFRHEDGTGGNKIAVFANVNNQVCARKVHYLILQFKKGLPFMLIVNLDEAAQPPARRDLDCFKDQEEDLREWLLNEVVYYDARKKVCLLYRSCNIGEFLDVLNLDTVRMTYSAQIEPESGIIEWVFSPDYKYFLEYEQQSHGSEDNDVPMLVLLKINSIVSIQASLLYYMMHHQIVSTFDGEFATLCIRMLTESTEHRLISQNYNKNRLKYLEYKGKPVSSPLNQEMEELEERCAQIGLSTHETQINSNSAISREQ